MSLHTDLAIYHTAEKLLDLVLGMQRNLPREFRQVLGQRLADLGAEILVCVGRANRAKEAARIPHLEALAGHIEAATLLLRAAQRQRAISTKIWAQSAEITDSLGKQCTGWLKTTRLAFAGQQVELPVA